MRRERVTGEGAVVSLLEFVKPCGQVAQHVQALGALSCAETPDLCPVPPHSCFVSKHGGSDLGEVIPWPNW